MPRVARIVVPGVPHHVTQRGNNRPDVFLADEHRAPDLAPFKAVGCLLEKLLALRKARLAHLPDQTDAA